MWSGQGWNVQTASSPSTWLLIWRPRGLSVPQPKQWLCGIRSWMAGGTPILLRGGRCRGQLQPEGRSLAGRALDGEGPGVGGHDGVGDGEAEPHALRRPGAVGREEGLEDAFEDLGRDARAVVLHLQPGPAIR